MDIELRHLRYFLAVAEELHFGRAAARLRIAQPPLSQQIRKLEDELGVELFHRTSRRVELSEAGQALLPEVRLLFEQVGRATDAAQHADRGTSGHLRIGFVGSAADGPLPRIVGGFRQELPGVSLTLNELGVDEQLEALRAGRLDVGFVRGPLDEQGLNVAEIYNEPLVVAIPQRHRFARRKQISARDLRGEALVLLSREEVPGLFDQVIAICQQHGFNASVEQQSTSIQAVLGLVAAGLGVSVLPRSVESLRRVGVRFLPLRGSRTTLLVAWREDGR
ncbi:MAG TPA: LysR substrate-binding domain-containing protein, partial [Solirubrobacterales bacterium]